jgi:23S rRNA (cytidine2498-2'-O)-methyltransferase
MIDRWIDAHAHASFVVTLKFQGKTDMTPVLPFFARRGGTIVHLHHNKHELTWMRLGAPIGKRRRRRVE